MQQRLSICSTVGTGGVGRFGKHALRETENGPFISYTQSDQCEGSRCRRTMIDALGWDQMKHCGVAGVIVGDENWLD